MKRLLALTSILAAILAASQAFSQEIPSELKAKIEAKSAELNAGNSSAQKAWERKQIAAWESIQSLTFSIDKDELDSIKSAAEKKFPLEYAEQEKFITEQANLASGLADYKVQLGKDAYAAIKKKFATTGESDFNKLTEELQKQVGAKNDLAGLKPEGIDEMTFAITKQVIEKKFPNDFVSQLDAIKKQFDITAAAQKEAAKQDDPFASDANASAEDKSDENAPEKKERPLTMGELNKIAKENFQKQSFVVEGKKKCTAITTEIKGKQVIMMPFTAYDAESTMTIMNNLGETVDFDQTELYASKSIPVIIFFPKSVPQDIVFSKLPEEKNYRPLINQSIFFVGQSNLNVQSFPVKIVSLTYPFLNLSTKVPSNFLEGTLLLDPKSDLTLGMLIDMLPPPTKIKWTTRSEVNRLARRFNYSADAGYLRCVRLDKFGGWEKVDLAKLADQKKTLERYKAVVMEFIDYFCTTNMGDMQNKRILGSIISRHFKEFKNKMDRQRFERMYRIYLQELAQLLKSELRDINPDEFYTIYRDDVKMYVSLMQDLKETFENAFKNNSFMEFVHNDVKRNISK